MKTGLSARRSMNIDTVLTESRKLRKANRHADSLKLLNEALERTPDARLYYSRAMTYDLMEQSAKAVEDLTSAIALDKTNPMYFFDRGSILASPLDRDADAIPDFEEAIRLKPDFADAHRQCCGCLLIMGRPNRALEHAEAALKLEPDEASSHFFVGEAYISLKQFGRAVAALRRAVELDPTMDYAVSALRRAEERVRPA
jgi:tetratricopeptide (TPR) repeat protein